jgi:hypothetical protein
MLKWYLNSMLNKLIMITHKCRFITWRCGSYFCCMCFTTFSDSTPRAGNIFYRVNLQSERRLSFLVLSELVGSEIEFLRNSSPAVSLVSFFNFYWFVYVFIVVYSNCFVFSFLLSHTICFTGKQNLINFNNYKTLFTSFRQLTTVIICAYVRDADDSDYAYFNFSLHLLLVEILVPRTGHCYLL